MIVGIGTDLLDIRRMAAALERFGDRFVERLFTDIECARARRRPNPAAVYSQCFAAKEACSKALGTGIRQGVYWRDMGVQNLPSGKPFLVLTGGARKRLDDLTPDGMTAQIDLSLTDEIHMAHAMVVISALSAP
ncbi:MAG: holo-ACP synthase [Rhodospirillales bacterium]|jgi:holo-[acyl-carrier protein] synthase|nr:holo-ACP synthase [Rhodospirillales bacterium]MDP6883756.1 holo-ACP synthase [Rhodospirillales bacterium]